MEDNAEKKRRAIKSELKQSGFDVKVRIEHGIPFVKILAAEEEEHVSIVCIGSHGVSIVQDMLLESISEKVIRKSRKSVLVVRRSELTPQ